MADHSSYPTGTGNWGLPQAQPLTTAPGAARDSTYDLAKSVAAAVADRLLIKVDVCNIPNFCQQVANIVTTQVLTCLRNEAAQKEQALKAEAKKKRAKERRAAK